MRIIQSLRLVATLSTGLWLGISSAGAAELLSGTVALEDGQSASFGLTGEDRQNVVGGLIRLGDRSYTITKVSRLGLIGASTPPAGGSEESVYVDFAVFSSSFSEQTAVGQPWVAAHRYVNCDAPYNSFLATYRVSGEQSLSALGNVPYDALTRSIQATPESAVYCFVSRQAN